jgi:hypothetical protein
MSSFEGRKVFESVTPLILSSVTLTGGGGASSANLTQNFNSSGIAIVSVQLLYACVAPVDVRFTMLSVTRLGIANAAISYATCIGTLPAEPSGGGVAYLSLFNSSSPSTETTSAQPLLYNNAGLIMSDNLGTSLSISSRPTSLFTGAGKFPLTFRLLLQNMDAVNSLTLTRLSYILG